jgi:hypothetical protein
MRYPLGKTNCRRVHNIKTHVVERVFDELDWIGLALNSDSWRALVNAVMNLQVHWNAGKFSSGCTTRVLSSGTLL